MSLRPNQKAPASSSAKAIRPQPCDCAIFRRQPDLWRETRNNELICMQLGAASVVTSVFALKISLGFITIRSQACTFLLIFVTSHHIITPALRHLTTLRLIVYNSFLCGKKFLTKQQQIMKSIATTLAPLALFGTSFQVARHT